MLFLLIVILYSVVRNTQQRNNILLQTLNEFTSIQKRNYSANLQETFSTVMLYITIFLLYNFYIKKNRYSSFLYIVTS